LISVGSEVQILPGPPRLDVLTSFRERKFLLLFSKRRLSGSSFLKKRTERLSFKVSPGGVAQWESTCFASRGSSVRYRPPPPEVDHRRGGTEIAASSVWTSVQTSFVVCPSHLRVLWRKCSFNCESGFGASARRSCKSDRTRSRDRIPAALTFRSVREKRCA
jgi:hypothetical protein